MGKSLSITGDKSLSASSVFQSCWLGGNRSPTWSTLERNGWESSRECKISRPCVLPRHTARSDWGKGAPRFGLEEKILRSFNAFTCIHIYIYYVYVKCICILELIMDFEFDLLSAHAHALKKIIKKDWTCQEVSRTTSYSYLFMARAGLPSSFYNKFLVGVTCGGFRDWIPIVNPFWILKNTKVPRVLDSHNGHGSSFYWAAKLRFFALICQSWNLPLLMRQSENWGCHFFYWFLAISFFEPQKITIRLVDVLKTSHQQSIFPDSSWLKRLQRQEWIFVPPMVMETVGLDTASGQPPGFAVTFETFQTLVVETLNVMCMKVMIDNWIIRRYVRVMISHDRNPNEPI